MKIETTRKYMRYLWDDVLFSVGYCGAQALLRGAEATAYNAGVYGWNCDYYIIDGVCICTGYHPHGRDSRPITGEYEKKAQKVWDNNKYTWETKMKKVAALRTEWVAALRNS